MYEVQHVHGMYVTVLLYDLATQAYSWKKPGVCAATPCYLLATPSVWGAVGIPTPRLPETPRTRTRTTTLLILLSDVLAAYIYWRVKTETTAVSTLVAKQKQPSEVLLILIAAPKAPSRSVKTNKKNTRSER